MYAEGAVNGKLIPDVSMTSKYVGIGQVDVPLTS